MRAIVLLVCFLTLTLSAAMPFRKIWHFNNLRIIDGNPVTLLGHPKIVDTEHGKAVQFNGVDDALFLKVHPMQGAEKWTWEVVFRPDVGGNAEQRFFHFQEQGTENRMLFEIRVIGDKWCLDSFVKGGEGSKALMDRTKLHPLGKWYRVATVYDGKELKNYVDGVLEGSGEVKLEPLKAGGTSVGVRYTKVDYFKGAVLLSRTTAKALAPSEFLELSKPRQ